MKGLTSELVNARDHLASSETKRRQLQAERDHFLEREAELVALKEEISNLQNHGLEHQRISQQASQLALELQQAIWEQTELAPLQDEVTRLGDELSQLRREQLEYLQIDLERINEAARARSELLSINQTLTKSLQEHKIQNAQLQQTIQSQQKKVTRPRNEARRPPHRRKKTRKRSSPTLSDNPRGN